MPTATPTWIDALPLPAAVFEDGRTTATSPSWPLGSGSLDDLLPGARTGRDEVLDSGAGRWRLAWSALPDGSRLVCLLTPESDVASLQSCHQDLDRAAHTSARVLKTLGYGVSRVTQRIDDFLDEVTRLNHAVLERTRSNLDRTRRMTEATARAIGMVEEFQRQVTEVGQLAAAVDDIMLQTRILSLNARVEAAKAGERGKSFAVVADEVGNLANTTKQVSQRIQDTANQIIESAPECLAAMEVVDDACQEAELAATDLTERMHHQEQLVGQARVDLSPDSQARRDVDSRIGELEQSSARILEEITQLAQLIEGLRG